MIPLLPRLHAALRRLAQRISGESRLGWTRRHPFDRLNGTDTSGVVASSALPAEEAARVHAVCYAGSQPSVVRRALSSLPALSTLAFVDLGCGKGRALLVAAELPFRQIVGVELSEPLTRIARKNAAAMSKRHPRCSMIHVEAGDASTAEWPAGDLALFLYHPFGPELVAVVAARVARALEDPARSIFVVYYNPVAGDCFDACPGLSRRSAETLPYAATELGFGPDDSDLVVTWQGGPAAAPASRDASARIALASGGLRATLGVTESLSN